VRIPHPRVVLAAVLVAAGVVGAANAWTYWPPSHATKTAVARALVGYELAAAPIWPPGYYGTTAITPQIDAALQAGYARTARTYAAGLPLAWLLSHDYARRLTMSRTRRHGLIDVAATGRVVYYDFRSRKPNGDLVVRAAVEHTFTSGRWDARGRTLSVGRPLSVPDAVIFDYTLRRFGTGWKVVDAVGWRFLDVPSGRVTYDLPANKPQ
jgi:hypothetical protein